eukprot:NODE_182_length_15748_cov_0.173174.p8 type:complete len:262 gc:universal NODE_182_length_15748_cov_0.173174:12451-13236(+)
MPIKPVILIPSCIAVSALGYLYGRTINKSSEEEVPVQIPTVDIYDRIAQDFDKSTCFDETLMGIPILRRALVGNCSGDVLEIGIGTGKNLPYYPFRKMKSLTMVDFSTKMLSQVEKKLNKTSKSWTYWMNPIPIYKEMVDCQNLPFHDESFDTILSTFTLCSIDDHTKALQEMKRVLKPNGRILFLEHGLSCTNSPAPNSLKYDVINRRLNTYKDTHHSNWGCTWNKNIGQIIESVFENSSNKFWRWHFGTTLYAVVSNSP